MHDFQKTVTSALKLINNYLLLRDDFRIGLVISLRVAVSPDFRIGLVISPRVAVLAWGDTATLRLITRPIRKSSRNDIFIN